MRIVVALGGNALLRRGEPLTEANQRANVRRAAVAIAPLCADGSELIITHGNGPQVGLLALQSAAGPEGSQQPLDVLSAETEGMLGYLIERELRNALPQSKEVVSVLSQVLVDPTDPAFSAPTKPIGPLYSQNEAQRLSVQRGWSIVRDGSAWRRAVASPRPLSILELSVVALLASRGVVVICVGGGGIPVTRGDDGRLYGVEAVIDKDHASALLARELGADCLLLLTDVDSVDWRGASARSLAAAGPNDLDLEKFEPGSMRPKLEAAIEFVRRTGRRAAIGRLEDAPALLMGTAGTVITQAQAGLRLRDQA
jgi:carbamate kinase